MCYALSQVSVIYREKIGKVIKCLQVILGHKGNNSKVGRDQLAKIECELVSMLDEPKPLSENVIEPNPIQKNLTGPPVTSITSSPVVRFTRGS